MQDLNLRTCSALCLCVCSLPPLVFETPASRGSTTRWFPLSIYLCLNKGPVVAAKQNCYLPVPDERGGITFPGRGRGQPVVTFLLVDPKSVCSNPIEGNRVAHADKNGHATCGLCLFLPQGRNISCSWDPSVHDGAARHFVYSCLAFTFLSLLKIAPFSCKYDPYYIAASLVLCFAGCFSFFAPLVPWSCLL